MAVLVRLTALPKALTEKQLRSSLRSWTEDARGVDILEMTHHKKSSSALVDLPSRPCQQQLSRHLHGSEEGQCARVRESKEHSIRARLAKTQQQPPKGATKSNKNGKSTWTSTAARSFHSHVQENPTLLQAASDRNGAHEIFAKFMSSHASLFDAHQQTKATRTESLVFARMRQLRLLKNKRAGDHVIVCFAVTPGVFPSVEEQKETRRGLLQKAEVDKSDKNGVVVEDPAAASLIVSRNERASVSFRITTNENGVELKKVRLQGPHARFCQVVNKEDIPLTLFTASPEEITITCLIPKIGLHRILVSFDFISDQDDTSFSIVRTLKINSVRNKEMNDALKPTAPYEKRKKKRQNVSKFSEVLRPPPMDSRSKANPFKALPASKIPAEISELIAAGELERTLEFPTTDNIDKEYGTFWKTLLWASEHQAFNDIELFDMEGAVLRHHGRLMSLTVPGLAESRPSVLRGDQIRVSWKNNLYFGRVAQLKMLDVMLEFHPSFHSKYNPSVDRVDVRFTFSRMGYRTGHEGCLRAQNIMKKFMLSPTAPALLTSASRSLPQVWRWGNQFLNEEQQESVKRIVMGKSRPLPYIIFGPPGTGKTTTVVESVYQLARHSDQLKVLLVAPSNDATDVLAARLAQYFPPSEMSRILPFSRSVKDLPEAVQPYAQDTASPEDQLEAILTSRVVVATVNMAAKFSYFGLPVGHFDVLCVDEAGHATEPEVVSVVSTLLDCDPFTTTERGTGQLVMAGDPRQLGPIISSSLCKSKGMELSYMERLMATEVYKKDELTTAYNPDLLTKLVRNYRSHPEIIKLPNQLFYDNELQAHADKMVSHSMHDWEHLPRKGFPIIFHALQGDNLREASSPSWFNPQEAMQVVEYVTLLMTESRPPVSADEIGIITPYNRQAHKIREALKLESTISAADAEKVKVGSVETFQGQERRVIILSTVRSETKHLQSDMRHHLGFVTNEKRFNVAVTRARALLIVIGSPDVLATDKDNWLPFLLDCKANESWVGEEWEYEPEESDDEEEPGARDSNESWIDVEDPSPLAEESFAFVSREE